jgi:transcriptional regulator with XRE-family HTH domain
MSRQNLTHIETGRHHINAVNLWKLACLFECSPSEFFPDIIKGYGLNRSDLCKVKKIEPNAVEWAKEMFGEKKKDDI